MTSSGLFASRHQVFEIVLCTVFIAAMGSTEGGHIQQILEGLNLSTKSVSQLRMMCDLGPLSMMCFEAKIFGLKFINEHQARQDYLDLLQL